VVEIDAASNGRVDEIRDLAARAQLAPMRGRYRVYIIDEAHGLSAAGGQAFLKLLEEPPAHVVFMLATTDPEKMLHTNRSRCTQFELTPPTTAELVENISRVMSAEGVSPDPAIAREIVDSSEPELGVRGTLMTLEKILPVLRSARAVSPDEIAELLGRPPQSRIESMLRSLAAGDVAAAVRSYWDLRASFPRSQLLSRLATVISDELTASTLHPAKHGSLNALVAAADSLVSARRDDSDLAAVAMLIKLAGLDLQTNSETSAPASTVSRDLPPIVTPPSSPAPAQASGTGHQAGSPKEVSSEPAVDSLVHTVAKPISPAPEPVRQWATDISGFVYANDPFVSDPEITTGSLETLPAAVAAQPDVDLEPAPSSDADEVFLQLLNLLNDPPSAAARLLVAKLRPARPVLEANTLVLHLPPQTAASVAAAPEFLRAQTILGHAVSFRTPAGTSPR
jgi:DNA polymerase-3 subunit gamma/tau